MRSLIKSPLSLLILPSFLSLSCESGNDRSAADFAVPVAVEKVHLSPIADFVSATGTIQAQRQEKVIAEVGGILHIIKSNGTMTKNGLTVEPRMIIAEIENEEWRLEVRVESQRMAMANAEKELEKQTGLFKEGGVTEKELEIARKSALDARLNYESAKIRAEKLILRAPIPGIITNLQSSFDGTYVPNNFHLCTVTDYKKVVVAAKLPNTDIGRIEIDQKAQITNYALQDETFMGEVVSIDPTIDPQTRTFTVNIVIDNKDSKLRPGMFVKVDIISQFKENAVVIPKDALQTRENRTVVFIVEGVSAEMREVITGIATKEDIEVISGLSEGERLVVKGHETLRDKSKVRVTE